MGYLRKAGAQDAELLFHWVNEAQVRKKSFSSSAISYEEYIQWFADMLSGKNTVQYIYLDDDGPAGQIRADVCGQEVVISYSVCAEKRFMGCEQDMLGLLQERVRHDFPQVRKLITKVETENIASQKMLMDLGYEEKYDVFELEIGKNENVPKIEICAGGVLYLTNNRNALGLYDWLRRKCPVSLYSDRLELCQIQRLQPELVVSYNYSYLIKEEIIQYMKGNIINLHISYLPWNRGVSPNLWSFVENTPKGVTIHQVSTEFDEGKIMYQKQCFFDPKAETFETAYQKLNQAVSVLFMEKWEEIRSHRYILSRQEGKGSSHTKKDLQAFQALTGICWEENIAQFLRRYKKMKETGEE